MCGRSSYTRQLEKETSALHAWRLTDPMGNNMSATVYSRELPSQYICMQFQPRRAVRCIDDIRVGLSPGLERIVEAKMEMMLVIQNLTAVYCSLKHLVIVTELANYHFDSTGSVGHGR
jgi:hypothetical protein